MRLRASLLAALLLTAAAGRTDDLPLEELLRRAGAYVVDYEQRFSVIVAEEEYMQYLLATRGAVPRRSRSLRSDILFVRVPGDIRWLGFRDVYRVDGRAIRDREARLEKLFLESPGSAVAQARAIVRESARYNIGGAQRDFNTPTIPLLFLHPANQHRFAFQLKGSKKVSGKRCRVMDFEESARPTLIRGPLRTDLPTRGRLFVTEEDGAVVKTELAFSMSPRQGPYYSTSLDSRAKITVTYDWHREIGLWLPKEMSEDYTTRVEMDEVHRASGSAHVRTGSQHIMCKAKYKNYRRFEVQTEERYSLPR
jgi:hypothetical protein